MRARTPGELITKALWQSGVQRSLPHISLLYGVSGGIQFTGMVYLGWKNQNIHTLSTIKSPWQLFMLSYSHINIACCIDFTLTILSRCVMFLTQIYRLVVNTLWTVLRLHCLVNRTPLMLVAAFIFFIGQHTATRNDYLYYTLLAAQFPIGNRLRIYY